MHVDFPILHLSNYTPQTTEKGLHVSASKYHKGVATSAVWIHGILILEKTELNADTQHGWLMALNVVAISEADQDGQSGSLCSKVPLLDHVVEVHTLSNDRFAALPFSFDLGWALGQGLGDDHYFVHVSARQYCSIPVRIMRGGAQLVTCLERPSSVQQQLEPVDKLIAAYDAWSNRQRPIALELFRLALENERVRQDLDSSHLRNAARCASQFAQEVETDNARELFQLAANWLQEDYTNCSRCLVQTQDKYLQETEKDRKGLLKTRRQRILSELGIELEAEPVLHSP